MFAFPGRPASTSLTTMPVIDGELVSSWSSHIDVLDPSTGATVATVPDVGAEGVDRAVRSATRAMGSWGAMAPRDRSAHLLRLADAVAAHADDLVAIEALDVGKPVRLVPAEVASAVDKIRFYAGAARQLSGLAANEYRPPLTSFVRRDPVGVVAALTPWNYPLAMAVWKVGPALAAGNTVVLKPSPETPLSTLRFAEIAAQILPPGVLNVVTGGIQVGQALVTHEDVAMVSLTGGTATGKAVMSAAASSLKRLHLELGGNASVLIFNDADLDKLRDSYFMAAFRNTGQDCHAASRVYAAPEIVDDVVDIIRSVAETSPVGDPFDPGVLVGPLVSRDQHSRITRMVEDALSHPYIERVTHTDVPSTDGFYFPLTVLKNVRHDDVITQDEIFGPVVTVSAFSDEKDAIRRANGVSQGLAASIWTGGIDRALRISKQLKVGTVWINTHGETVAEMPFGGMKESGFGRDLSIYSMEQHTDLKHIAIHVSDA